MIKLKNKKAQSILDVFVFLSLAFFVVVMVFVLIYCSRIITNSIVGIDTPANTLGINVSETAKITFGNLNNGINNLKMVGFVIIFGMVLTIFISSFLVRAHPVFAVVYLFIAILAVILAMVIQNSYDTMLADNLLGGVMQEGSAINMFMSNITTWTLVICFVGGIFVFSGLLSPADTGQGGLG